MTKTNKFRSGYEKRVYNNATSKGWELDFERADSILLYTVPARRARYIPDFLLPNGILVETKGRLTAADRAKMLNVKRDNPEADIRFLFQRSNQRITKSPNSLTYGQWADKHNFIWSTGDTIPEEWFNEGQLKLAE